MTKTPADRYLEDARLLSEARIEPAVLRPTPVVGAVAAILGGLVQAIAEPEAPDQERARLQAEYDAIATSGQSTAEANARARARMEEIRARLVVLSDAARIGAFWRALSDAQRHELASSCCRGCGSLDTSCRCWNDE